LTSFQSFEVILNRTAGNGTFTYLFTISNSTTCSQL
jgi:hypothetical protein